MQFSTQNVLLGTILAAVTAALIVLVTLTVRSRRRS
jgi:hypothetical protein